MRFLVLANFGMGLYKFRKELLEELIEQNHEIYISFPEDEYTERLKDLGCIFINTRVDRRGANPLKDFALFFSYLKIIRKLKPDAVLTYTIKPNIYGGMACRLTKTPYLSNVTGLGSSAQGNGFLRSLSHMLYKIGLRKAQCVFFQNQKNRDYFLDNRIITGRNRVIPGSGVNIQKFAPEEYPGPDKPIRFLFIGRIMKEKGIEELLEAARRIKCKYPDTFFDIVGFTEEAYAERLVEAQKAGIITYHGQHDDVRPFICESHATVLPSYHEGTSNVLLESAASARPILASRIPGCMEAFDEGQSGIGFEARDVDSLVDALIEFIELPYEKKKAMGLAGRAKIQKEYDRRIVIAAYIEEIERVRSNGL